MRISSVLQGVRFAASVRVAMASAAVVLTLGAAASGAYAQDFVDEVIPEIPAEKEYAKLPPVQAAQIPSLFWTYQEMTLLDQIKRGAVIIPTVEESELQPDSMQMPDGSQSSGPAILPGYRIPRDLRLSGMVYKAPDDWVVWINGIRITPGDKPKEIKHLSVYQDYVEMKWFDAMTNTIYPIRIKPAQRFNIDARSFLPG